MIIRGNKTVAVMAGLVPAIHAGRPASLFQTSRRGRGVDGRDKPGHDGSRREIQGRSFPSDHLKYASICFLALLALLFTATLALAAAPNFPALSGRVVDAANILSADQRASLDGKLSTLESQSGIQLVVAT